MFINVIFLVLSLIHLIQSSTYDDNFNLDQSQRYVALSGVAYCTNPVFLVDTVEDWSCQACKGFPNVTASTFHNLLTDGNGFIAMDHDANEIIISFSGTNPLSIRNWIDDLDFIQVSYPLCPSGCKVHKGFYDTYNSVVDQVIDLLGQYAKSYPDASISITGHSLGAALAAHCAADILSRGYKFKTLYTYGMPRVGDEDYEKWYTSVIPGTFRLVHHKDPVPQVPLEIQNYHHMPYEVFYVDDYNKWQLCSIEGEDPNCSDKYAVDLDVVDHLHYVGFDFTTNWFSCEL